MKKAVLMSIKPEWVKHIFLNCDKIYEVRKRAPLLNPPYKVYVYCTKSEPELYVHDIFGERILNGKVCGEFTCTKHIEVEPPFHGKSKGTCVTDAMLVDYAGGETLTYLEITNPVLYGAMKDITDYSATRQPMSWQYVNEVEDGRMG